MNSLQSSVVFYNCKVKRSKGLIAIVSLNETNSITKAISKNHCEVIISNAIIILQATKITNIPKKSHGMTLIRP